MLILYVEDKKSNLHWKEAQMIETLLFCSYFRLWSSLLFQASALAAYAYHALVQDFMKRFFHTLTSLYQAIIHTAPFKTFLLNPFVEHEATTVIGKGIIKKITQD